MISIILVLATITAVVTYRWLSNHLRIRKILSTVPGPKQYPILGVVVAMSRVSREDRMNWITDLCYQFKNGIVLLWIGLEPLVIIRKPHQIETILTSTKLIKKARTYDILLKPWLGEGLITATGDTWFNHRRLITPAFHFGVLEEYAAVMRNNVESLNELIATEVQKNGKAPIDIFEIVNRYTLDTICETAMGVSVHALHQPNNEYCQALHNFSRLSSDRIIKFWMRPDFIYYRTQSGKKFLHAIKTMHNFTENIIIKKQKERATKKMSNIKETEEFNGKRKPKAFLDLLMDANESADYSLSLRELREEVDTFMFAGQDTTAIGISNVLFALGNAPEIQAKVHEELKEVFGDSTATATTKELGQLNYLGRVIKETLRLYPSAPVVSRDIEYDTVIDGHLIPKGTAVSVNIYQLHHDPDVWSDPETFDPDRFLPENAKGRHVYSYIPFSAGPRNCIGQKFAYLEIKTVSTAILRKWKVSSVLKPLERKMAVNVTLKPASGKIEMFFTPLDGR